MDRKNRLLELLKESDHPITGMDLAQQFGVTRQVIVKDIAVLRAKGFSIVATPQGYFQPKRLVAGQPDNAVYRVITIKHAPEQTELELTTLVDAGVTVLDVSVDHPIYGEFVANLMFSSRRDVQQFMRRLQGEQAPLLLTLTGGVHRHTLCAKESEAMHEALTALRTLGFELMEDS